MTNSYRSNTGTIEIRHRICVMKLSNNLILFQMLFGDTRDTDVVTTNIESEQMFVVIARSAADVVDGDWLFDVGPASHTLLRLIHTLSLQLPLSFHGDGCGIVVRRP